MHPQAPIPIQIIDDVLVVSDQIEFSKTVFPTCPLLDHSAPKKYEQSNGTLLSNLESFHSNKEGIQKELKQISGIELIQ